MKIKLENIEMDTSIQCRASIDTSVVNEYAERMAEGDEFPPVEVYGDESQCWIGDGWHRIMAARQVGVTGILATVHQGGRADALKHALGANSSHGHRRTNADKHRSVEIALKEFSMLSSRAIAEMCGVSHPFVESIKSQVVTVSTCEKTENKQQVTTAKVVGSDGKQYPSKNKTSKKRSRAKKEKKKLQEQDKVSTEFEQVYRAFEMQLLREKRQKWEFTSKLAAMNYITALEEIIKI